MTSSPTNNSDKVLFETKPRFHPLLVALWALGPALMVIQMVYSLLSKEEDIRSLFPMFAFLSIALTMFLGAILPQKIQVLDQNATVVIRTLLRMDWRLDDCQSANSGFLPAHCKLRLKLTTNWTGFVHIHRPSRMLDVLVTPMDPEGLVAAIEQSAASAVNYTAIDTNEVVV